MRKKLFAVIMSAMMMITFMPTMAFATPTDGWQGGSKYNDMSYYDEATSKWLDVVKAVKVSETSEPAAAVKYTWTDGQVYLVALNANGTIKSVNSKGYYDLGSASVTKVLDVWDKNAPSFDKLAAESIFGTLNGEIKDVNELTFSLPSGVNYVVLNSGSGSLAGVGTHGVAAKSVTSFTGVEFGIMSPYYDEDKMFEDQTFNKLQTVQMNINSLYDEKAFIGSVPTSSIKISKASAAAANAKYLLDGKAQSSVYYNGGEHKLTQKAMSGVTTTYKLLNKKTGSWEDVSGDAVVVKDAGTYNVIATAKDANETYTHYISFVVDEACDAVIGFEKSEYKVAGKYDAKSYVTAYLDNDYYDVYDWTAARKAINKDKKALLEYFNACYDVVVVDNYAYFEAKDLTSAQEKEIKDKYGYLEDNYDDIHFEDGAKFEVVDDISFSKAPLKKTYTAKKGKLPKNKTFYVKAKAASGSKLVYKITKGAGKITVNRTTGKVTVKKGLKKGTYKVGVHAITVDSFNWGQADWVQDSYTLKIKVK